MKAQQLSTLNSQFSILNLSLPLPATIKKEVIMKPFWRNTLRVLKVIGKIFVWLTGADSPVNDSEKKTDGRN